MKQAQGWNAVIRFDDIESVEKARLSPGKQAEYTACQLMNHFIDIFNTQPLPVRLACVAQLFAVVNTLAVAAVAASVKRLPYFEPNRFDVVKDGKQVPLYHLLEEMPGNSAD